MTDTIDFLKYYSKQNWDVFPCLPNNKTPLGKWPEMATHEENMLLGYWDMTPNANVGMACGKRSGVIVLDVDADHEGYESLKALQEQYGQLPKTIVAATGGGGEHIYFKHPGFEIRNSAGKLGRGLDIRGDGGYVIVPPSLHPNGKAYKWVVKPSETELADAPDWMLELLQERTIITPTQSDGKIFNGGRNVALSSIAGSMRRKGLSEDSIFSALQIYNREHCNPPLTDGEVLQISKSISRYTPQDEIKAMPPLPSAFDVIDVMEAEIIERQKNPVDVWGIHYAWPFLSLVTGGKQKGELIIVGGEPGVGKSWWTHQDALFTAVGNPDKKIPSVPTLIWSGEMQRKQVYRRFFEMMGVPKRHMLTGNMSNEDWAIFNEAKAIIVNSPIYVSDMPLDLKDVKPLLEREQGEHGIEQVVFDYDWLIRATGVNEIEQSQNISRELKILTRELNLSIILVSSVNKGGMDTVSEHVTKSSLSGSGKKIHDADVIYLLTKFSEAKNNDMKIQPPDYDRITTLHIAKGRELDWHIPNKAINYMRETPNPKFRELKDLNKPSEIPSWIDRKDLE